jgi:glutathione synthase/RimK-type ligase-like ATP-grasp enzyme
MKQHKITTIGPRAYVKLEESSLAPIPAKVDTGADSSSIWATKITEEAGSLSFVLFDVGSPWYTGEVITTQKYSIKSIKNSFGTSEFRYKVPLKISLEGRKFKAYFTLANRANNRYPVLIGRQTLKSKFVVDVSRPFSAEEPARVLVLARVAGDVIRSAFGRLAEVAGQNLMIDVKRYDDLMMVADTDKVNVTLRSSGKDVGSYEFIHFLTRTRNAQLAAMVAAYAKKYGIPYADHAAGLLATDTKAHQGMLLSLRGIAMPRTVYMASSCWESAFGELEELLGLPFVFKDDHGLKGRNNFLVTDRETFAQYCQIVREGKLQMVAQAYIPNDGYYRIVIMGRAVALAMKRNIDSSRSHLYSKKIDAPAELVDPSALPGEVHQLAIAAAQQLSLEIAGVDVLQDKNTGMWYCLEVNNSPQLAGGAFVDEKLKALGAFYVQEMNK